MQPNKNSAKVGPSVPRVVRCAIYARKSTEEGLAQPFNSLDARLLLRNPLVIHAPLTTGWPDFFGSPGGRYLERENRMARK